MKNCSKLKRGLCVSTSNPQPFENFRPQSDRTDGRMSICKACEKEYTRSTATKNAKRSRDWYWNNRERQKLYKIVKYYGLSIDQYKAMVAQQNGSCAICLKKKELVVDHCHTTKRVRGLLCQLCNKAIGLMRDDKDTLLSAVRYLGRG